MRTRVYNGAGVVRRRAEPPYWLTNKRKQTARPRPTYRGINLFLRYRYVIQTSQGRPPFRGSVGSGAAYPRTRERTAMLSRPPPSSAAPERTESQRARAYVLHFCFARASMRKSDRRSPAFVAHVGAINFARLVDVGRTNDGITNERTESV